MQVGESKPRGDLRGRQDGTEFSTLAKRWQHLITEQSSVFPETSVGLEPQLGFGVEGTIGDWLDSATGYPKYAALDGAVFGKESKLSEKENSSL